MERKICEECGGKIIHKKVDYILLGQNLGKFPAEVCTKCGEQVFDEDVSGKIDVIAKQKGLWGLQAKTRVGKIGNSFNILINSKIARFLELKKGEEVVVYPESKNKLVITV
ncbi:MAG: YgiT-type zinc finger protein [Nanoarchaeota archaeon]|nr:YgiT-type zinc finger protein [Nanoarchaeota archaeon]